MLQRCDTVSITLEVYGGEEMGGWGGVGRERGRRHAKETEPYGDKPYKGPRASNKTLRKKSWFRAVTRENGKRPRITLPGQVWGAS